MTAVTRTFWFARRRTAVSAMTWHRRRIRRSLRARQALIVPARP